MRIFVAKERAKGETRVAATPETVRRLVKEGFEVIVEQGAGEGAHIPDSRFTQAGAEVVEGTAPAAQADILLRVVAPTPEEAAAYKSGALLVALMSPHANLDSVRALRDGAVSTLAMELVPRISRAQSMDALSSQASIAGYKAALLVASHLDKYMPLMMTAAGTVQPAKIVVMGAGVAGLQAIATCKRLGAVVEVSDIRREVKEQVESLGGRFIDLPLEDAAGEGGYAKEVSQEFLQKQQALVREKVVAADAVITTALIPGRPAPRLITADMIEAMRPGAVVVDLAVESGGNCELSECNKTVVKHDVIIIGHPNLPATLPADASTTYARNLQTLLLSVAKGAELNLDLEDEIVAGALLTHEGKVRHERTATALEQAAGEDKAS